jgi:hypothetical protein
VFEPVFGLYGCGFENADPSAGLLELHNAILEGEKRVIAPNSHISAWQHFRATLADQDASRCHCSAIGSFYSKPISVAVATVST